MIKSSVAPVVKSVYSLYTSTNSFTWQAITMPSLGTGYQETIGNNFVLNKLNLRFLFFPTLTTSTTDEAICLRILVLQIKPPAVITNPIPISASVFFNDSTLSDVVVSPLAYGLPKLAHVLHDKLHTMTINGSNASLTFDMHLTPRIKNINFDSTLGTYETGSIWVLVSQNSPTDWNNSAGFNYLFASRLYFTDV